MAQKKGVGRLVSNHRANQTRKHAANAAFNASQGGPPVAAPSYQAPMPQQVAPVRGGGGMGGGDMQQSQFNGGGGMGGGGQPQSFADASAANAAYRATNPEGARGSSIQETFANQPGVQDGLGNFAGQGASQFFGNSQPPLMNVNYSGMGQPLKFGASKPPPPARPQGDGRDRANAVRPMQRPTFSGSGYRGPAQPVQSQAPAPQQNYWRKG